MTIHCRNDNSESKLGNKKIKDYKSIKGKNNKMLIERKAIGSKNSYSKIDPIKSYSNFSYYNNISAWFFIFFFSIRNKLKKEHYHLWCFVMSTYYPSSSKLAIRWLSFSNLGKFTIFLGFSMNSSFSWSSSSLLCSMDLLYFSILSFYSS